MTSTADELIAPLAPTSVPAATHTVPEDAPSLQSSAAVPPTIEQDEIAHMQADLRDAQTRMRRAGAQFHLQAIAAAEAELRDAEEALKQIQNVPLDPSGLTMIGTPLGDAQVTEQLFPMDHAAAEVTVAEALVVEAEARLQALSSGPDPILVAAAQLQRDAAQHTLSDVAAQASWRKTLAEQHVADVAEQVRHVQTVWSEAYWRDQQAQVGIDPESGQAFDDTALDAATHKQHYALVLAAADQQLREIEAQLGAAQADLEQARQQEIEQVMTAQGAVDDAQAALEQAHQGPSPEAVAQAQADVEHAHVLLEQARQNLQAVTLAHQQAEARWAREGAKAEADVEAARATLEQIRRAAAASGSWAWPTFGTITSGFGNRDLAHSPMHNGLDIANLEGTPIGAARDGLVTEAGWCRGYGYCVKLHHDDGFSSEYGHLAGPPLVQTGQRVAVGTILGEMGTTYDAEHGGFSTNVHLHLTIRHDGVAVDPLLYLP